MPRIEPNTRKKPPLNFKNRVPLEKLLVPQLIYAFSSENIFFKLFCYIILAMTRHNRVRKLDGNVALGCGPAMDYP